MSAKHIDIDEMLNHVGEFGRFQKLIIFLFAIMNFYGSQVMIMYFAALSPDWKCANNSQVCVSNQTFSKNDNRRCQMNRKEWEFTEPLDFSVTTQFDLVCEKEWLISLTSAIFFIGWMVGGIVMGWFADNYGRKKVYYPSQFLLILVGFATGYCNNIILLITLRFIAGFIVPGTFVQAFVIISEYTGSKHRALAGNLFILFFSVAVCQIGIYAYFIRQWRYLFMVSTLPYLLGLSFYPIIPESARWLLTHGRQDEAQKVFKRIAQFNKKEFPKNLLIKMPNDNIRKKSNPLHLFKTKKLALSTSVQGFAWMIIGMQFYAFSFAADELGGSLYLNHILVNIVGVPVAFSVPYFCNKVGRKISVIISLLLSSIACILIPFLHGQYERVITGVLGKFFASFSFNAIYIWSVEIFPTVTRSEGMGFLQLTARIGSALAPFVVKVLEKVNHLAPFVLLLILGMISFGILILLPETNGKPIAEYNDDDKNVEEDLLLTEKQNN